MFRWILYLVIGLALAGFMRVVMRIIMNGFGELMQEQQTSSRGPATGEAKPGGELKKDPVCGTFVSTGSSVKKTVGGETFHFCSAACRDLYLT